VAKIQGSEPTGFLIIIIIKEEGRNETY